MTLAAVVQPGQIWRDDCYYLDSTTGECRPKYVLILAIAQDGDLLAAAFTSKSHGLSESPQCSIGPPRAGYFVGQPGGVLVRPTWLDFSSVQDVDAPDFRRWRQQNRINLLPRPLPRALFCGVLRCLLGWDDLTGRQARLVGDLAAAVGCP